MRFRRANLDDAKILLKWRNDPDTRVNSINMDEVFWENHLSWLEKTLKNPSRFLFVAEERGTPIGTVRADMSEDGKEFELSWTVAPEERGKGIGKRMVSLILSEDFLLGKKLKAEIKEKNIPSIKIAKSLGFQKEEVSDGLFMWTKEN